MPSPPTVSPLSTPAATQVNIGDNDDVPELSTEQLPPMNGANDPSSMVQLASANLSLATQTFGMKLGQAQMLDQPDRRSRTQLEAVATTDPEPSNADFSSRNMTNNMPNPQATVDPNAYMMNLAQATSTLFQNPGPAIVAPSEVSLQASFTQESDALTTSADHTSTSVSQKLESFARIEFADSVFQMTTYAVIIGRDQRAMDQARRDEKRELAYRRKVEENARNGLPPPTPLNVDRGKFSKSYVSEEGGMLGPESDGEDNARPVKKRRPSSAHRSQNGDDDAQSDHVKSNRQYVSHTPGAAAVDLGTLQPSPSHIPFVGIHSPGPDIASKTRGISRQHLKIEYNEKKGVFEAVALHKNGFFCDDTHYGLDDPVTLRSGDRLQIKDVEFIFVLNGVVLGKTGGEQYHEEETSSKRMSIGGKEMSFDFEHSDHENFRDTSDELSEIENVPTPVLGSDEGERDNEAAEEEHSDMGDEPNVDVVESAEIQDEIQDEIEDQDQDQDQDHGHDPSQPQFATPDMPKRRGPGRPPKDGIMSKRERRLLKKQMLETSKKTLPQDPQGDKIKRPVGRPRKNPAPEEGEKPEKRKYNKRKSKEDGDEGSDAERRAKEKKEKKVRPKSPPLELRKEDFTEEQLQKPTKNYGVLIDEALTNGPPDGLTLKQIYKRIMSKYPWFYFSAETKGWESSVRHNLIGNEAFKKAEGTGLWSRVPGVELDAGKKRKASSPDRQLGPPHLHTHLQTQQYYQNGSYLPGSNGGFGHNLPNYTADIKHPQTGYHASPSQPNHSHISPSSQPITQQAYPTHAPAPAQLPPVYLSRQPNNTHQSTYSSPYAKPPPQSNPSIKSEVSSAPNPQTLPAAPVQLPTSHPLSQQQQHQQQPVSNTPNNVVRPPLSAEIEQAIAKFREKVTDALSKQTNQAPQIIDSAINRARGLPAQTSVPAGFEPVEKSLMNAVQNMISEIQAKQQPQTTSASPAPAMSNAVKPTPTPSAPTQSPAPTATVEAEIQRRVKGFRDTMIVALRKKTDQAEAIVDLAINRARGMPNSGPIQGWEEADRLMVKSVTQIIADARRAHSLQVQPTPLASVNAAPPTNSSQPPQQAPSASPALAPSPAPMAVAAQASQAAPANQPSTQLSQATPSSIPKPAPPSFPRPGVSIQRPTPMGISRPGANSISRPSIARKDSGTASSVPSPSVATPTHSIPSPAPPSAGVVDQIAGQKRQHSDAFSNGNGGFEQSQPVAKAAMHSQTPQISAPVPPSANVVEQVGQKTLHEEGLGHGNERAGQPELAAKLVGPAPASTPTPIPASAPPLPHPHPPAIMHAPTPNICSPAPPSAGVVDQIAGQKRHLDEGPGGGMEQPEAKRAALSPT